MEQYDHYTVLGVTSSATHDQIKKNYQKQLLIHHPDKQRDQSVSAENVTEKFQRIQEAWEVLGDAERRKAYDLEQRLKNQAMSSQMSTELVSLSDFQISKNEVDLANEHDHQMRSECEGDSLMYSRPCRCGDFYEISQEDLSAGYNTIQCNGCSLYITVVL